jgi:hypothetical protein
MFTYRYLLCAGPDGALLPAKREKGVLKERESERDHHYHHHHQLIVPVVDNEDDDHDDNDDNLPPPPTTPAAPPPAAAPPPLPYVVVTLVNAGLAGGAVRGTMTMVLRMMMIVKMI